MRKRFAMLVAILIWLPGFVGLHCACAQALEQPTAGPSPGQGTGGGPPPTGAGGPGGDFSAPALQYVAPGVFEIGKCRIIKEEGKVELPAVVNMKEGFLEYLLVGNAGKLHESLLRTDVEPYSLQVALLLSGMEGSLNPLSAQGENRSPEGDPVDITVSWSEDGKEKKSRIEELVLQGKTPVSQIPWVFTGSMVHDGIFAAQVEKSIIAVFHDPVAMIDHRLESGSNDEAWTANGTLTPAVGTPVTVTISKKSQAPKNK